ncbi:MAG: hypothetical protein IT537_06420 [Hyphomicrobiales bacterium]|nr:hypothetical protein [Hyphomicrobiales bacterium]
MARLNAELRPIIDGAEVKGKLANAGFEASSSSPEELGELVNVQLVKWTRMIKAAAVESE